MPCQPMHLLTNDDRLMHLSVMLHHHNLTHPPRMGCAPHHICHHPRLFVCVHRLETFFFLFTLTCAGGRVYKYSKEHCGQNIARLRRAATLQIHSPPNRPGGAHHDSGWCHHALYGDLTLTNKGGSDIAQFDSTFFININIKEKRGGNYTSYVSISTLDLLHQVTCGSVVFNAHFVRPFVVD